ncbi:MAG: hypothetical protein FWE16_00200 [Firmicutes bacterium]|nr:hypothetical protein [Bacillota bacterium]
MSTVSIILMSVLILMEAASIATHLHLFRKKRKAINKNSEVVNAIQKEFAEYTSNSKDAYQSLIKDMAAEIADLKYRLNKIDGKKGIE